MSDKAILFVDDEVIILLAMKAEFKARFGDAYRYATAPNAKEALSIVDQLTKESVRILVVFSDWLMPGMKGDEFLAAIKRRYPSVTAVLVTGHADRDAIEKAMREGGVDACIRKPWITEDLFRLVEEAAGKAG